MLCRAESRPRMLALQVTAKNCYILARRTPRVISLILACCGIIATRETAYFSRLVFPHSSNFSLLPFLSRIVFGFVLLLPFFVHTLYICSCAFLALQALLACVFRQCFSQSPYLCALCQISRLISCLRYSLPR